MDQLKPKDHAEAVAILRSEIVGALLRRDLERGELASALQELSSQRFRPPGCDRTRSYAVATLERWYYALRKRGLAALRPRPRSDRGRGQELTPEQRELLLAIRREHTSASVPLILRTLIADGRLQKDAVSESTVRRLYVEQGLDRIPLRDGQGPKARLRWEAERPGALWHGDVCYGPSIRVGDESRPVRIHALLDDASRYVIVLEALHSEREADLLKLLIRAVRRHGPPDALYLDNGPTYRGDILRTACARMGISLLHARPYDPQARGKMERWWRTLREGCLDFVGQLASLHELNVRLWAWLDEHYHSAPHASLFGRAPAIVYETAPRPTDGIDEQKLRDALTVRSRRRVRRDSTLPLDGTDWETDQGWLAGRLVTVGQCLVDPEEPPWLEHEGKRLRLRRVDPVSNGRKKRPPRRSRELPRLAERVGFDPPGALLERATGRARRKPESES